MSAPESVRRKTTEQGRQLIEKATDARSRAYAPYSSFLVGAALLGRDGRVFQGCNVENASYGLTICAERSAVFAAVSAGCRRFSAMAIVGHGHRPPRPCGACLQVVAEFCDDDFVFMLALEDAPDRIETYALKELLPERFTDPLTAE